MPGLSVAILSVPFPTVRGFVSTLLLPYPTPKNLGTPTVEESPPGAHGLGCLAASVSPRHRRVNWCPLGDTGGNVFHGHGRHLVGEGQAGATLPPGSWRGPQGLCPPTSELIRARSGHICPFPSGQLAPSTLTVGEGREGPQVGSFILHSPVTAAQSSDAAHVELPKNV